MKKAITAAVLSFGLIAHWGSARAYNGENCVTRKIARGDHCGSADSINVEITNRCDAPLYVKVCNQRPNRSWDCGVDFNLKPGRTNAGFWTCHSTGHYKWAACTDERECTFKDPRPSDE